MTYNPPYDDLPFARDDTQAKERAEYFRNLDPFPKVEPALLWSKHFIDYVRVTGMLHPFFPLPEQGRVKSASYEAHPGGCFVRWTPDGRKLVEDIKPGETKTFILPANSISFIQIESTIRLPEYIALRFNLRITHVHRGLLLGTGPLIDPQFEGNLLIPLHNLTDQDYQISQNEGLIWIEFTKTSHRMPAPPPIEKAEQAESHFVIEPYKKNRGPEFYFEKANHNNPIRSSIQGVVVEAQQRADAAEAAAEKALQNSRLFATIGFLAIAAMVITTVVALHQYFGQIGSLASTVQASASMALGKVDQAVSGAEDARRNAENALRGAEDARRDTQAVRAEVNELKIELQRLQSRLNPPQPPRP